MFTSLDDICRNVQHVRFSLYTAVTVTTWNSRETLPQIETDGEITDTMEPVRDLGLKEGEILPRPTLATERGH